MLEILTFTLGPVATNAYLLADSTCGEAVVIDPAWDGLAILEEALKRKWRIKQMWYTHAHFDHIGGAAAIADKLQPRPEVALHPQDQILWQMGGGGMLFGFKIDQGPQPNVDLSKVTILKLGSLTFQVFHTPGHTPGHCIFHCAKEQVLFSGDLIFHGSVGRTDLPGGDWSALEKSIREQVFTLPDDTRILSGHGPETSVLEERQSNPYVGEG